MSQPVPSLPCPIVAKLVAMLLENRSASPDREGRSMYVRLIDLEAEARRESASDATRQLIARVRRIAGTATIIPFPCRPRIAQAAAGRLR